MKKNGFVKDFARGNAGVEYVLSVINKYNPRIDAIENKTAGISHDIEIEILSAHGTSYVYTAEIKYDLYAKRSGNMAIEYHNSKKDKASGIAATAADYWIHVFDKPQEAYIIETEGLKQALLELKPVRIVENAGDGNANLYLYKKEVLLQKFVLLEDFLCRR